MFKITLTEYADHVEIHVNDGCLRLHTYTFDTKKEAQAFVSGMGCARDIANGMIQSLPTAIGNIMYKMWNEEK